MTALPLKKSNLQTFGEGQTDLFVGFPPNGSSNPASFNGSPYVSSVVHTSTGKYTITLDAGFRPKACLGLSTAWVNDNANAGLASLQLGPVTISAGSATTVVLYTLVSGSLADIAANAASLVRVSLRFKTYPKTDTTGL